MKLKHIFFIECYKIKMCHYLDDGAEEYSSTNDEKLFNSFLRSEVTKNGKKSSAIEMAFQHQEKEKKNQLNKTSKLFIKFCIN